MVKRTIATSVKTTLDDGLLAQGKLCRILYAFPISARSITTHVGQEYINQPVIDPKGTFRSF